MPEPPKHKPTGPLDHPHRAPSDRPIHLPGAEKIAGQMQGKPPIVPLGGGISRARGPLSKQSPEKPPEEPKPKVIHLDLSVANARQRGAFMRRPHPEGLAYLKSLKALFEQHPDADHLDLGEGMVLSRIRGGGRYTYKLTNTTRGAFGLGQRRTEIFLDSRFEHIPV